MSGQKVGCGAGSADLDGHPNLLRLAVGQSPQEQDARREAVVALEATIDDMTGEELGHAAEMMREEGALDAWFVPVYMKKERPGTCLTVLCKTSDVPGMEQLLWKHTTTLGFRCRRLHRRALRRSVEQVDTPWGPVQVKVAQTPEGPARCKPEYDDCSRIARREGLSLRDVRREVRHAWQSSLE
jgi:hypothetical protein